jgi:terminase small subunit-like protein
MILKRHTEGSGPGEPAQQEHPVLATRSPRRGKPRRKTVKRTVPKKTEGDAAAGDFEEIAARAARLGITPDRVLREYAAIAFADWRHILEWREGEGLAVKAPDKWGEADAAAVSEIAAGADPEHPRVKMYNKKAALDAIARHLGMFPLAPRRTDEPPAEEEGEDPREFLARELARLAAGAAEE